MPHPASWYINTLRRVAVPWYSFFTRAHPNASKLTLSPPNSISVILWPPGILSWQPHVPMLLYKLPTPFSCVFACPNALKTTLYCPNALLPCPLVTFFFSLPLTLFIFYFYALETYLLLSSLQSIIQLIPSMIIYPIIYNPAMPQLQPNKMYHTLQTSQPHNNISSPILPPLHIPHSFWPFWPRIANDLQSRNMCQLVQLSILSP